MMDERLEAGRHHLANGERALREGYFDDSRVHFETALLQFRGPELLLGEAHALRGLAQVDLHSGRLAACDESLRLALARYNEVVRSLDEHDPDGVIIEHRRDALIGEAATLVLLADVAGRGQRPEEARRRLQQAHALFEIVGAEPAAAGVFVMWARLSIQEADLQGAAVALQNASDIHEKTGDLNGVATVTLLHVELCKVAGDFPEALQFALTAVEQAKRTNDDAIIGRALTTKGGVCLQLGDVKQAHTDFTEALPLVVGGGDVLSEAYTLLGLAELASLAGQSSVQPYYKSAGLFAGLGHLHGMGTALLRLAQHCLRHEHPGFALAAAECARQLWLPTDVLSGVGQAFRWQVKALASLRQHQVLGACAWARLKWVGDSQPNARVVVDHYRGLLKEEWVSKWDAMDKDSLEAEAELGVGRILGDWLEGLDLDPRALGNCNAAMALIEAMIRVKPEIPSSTSEPVADDS